MNRNLLTIPKPRVAGNFGQGSPARVQCRPLTSGSKPLQTQKREKQTCLGGSQGFIRPLVCSFVLLSFSRAWIYFEEGRKDKVEMKWLDRMETTHDTKCSSWYLVTLHINAQVTNPHFICTSPLSFTWEIELLTILLLAHCSFPLRRKPQCKENEHYLILEGDLKTIGIEVSRSSKRYPLFGDIGPEGQKVKHTSIWSRLDETKH